MLLLLAHASLCADLQRSLRLHREVDWSDLQSCEEGLGRALALQLGVFATHAAASGLVARRAKAALHDASSARRGLRPARQHLRAGCRRKAF